MADESDRDILIRLDQRVSDIHRDMTQPEGRVPRLEVKVDKHAAQLNEYVGAVGMAKWIVAGIITLAVGFLGLAGALLDHLLKGGK